MPAISLQRLRKVRHRAQVLLRFVDSDLRPFLHELDRETFRRKPESPSITEDVNVTTTCSCVMALALSNTFRKFYDVEDEEAKAKEKASSIFERLIDAPWMSTGLTANNAFSTTLVFRTFGLLAEENLLSLSQIKQKSWELDLGISDIKGLAIYLKTAADDLAKFVWSSISDKSRNLIIEYELTDRTKLDRFKTKRLTAVIAQDIRCLIQSGSIYTDTRFPNITGDTKSELANWPTGYKLASLNHKLFVEQLPKFFSVSSKLSLPEIAQKIGKNPENFGINQYSATATVLYWFVDGLERGKVKLIGKDWEHLCNWATQEFNRERSRVLADHDAMMDPVAMAMAACLCSKLRNIAARAELGTSKAHREMLPSVVELEHSIQELFRRQAPSGIWPKYFPLFHYQDAGSNFCFTFEMLEAVLCEFGRTENNLLDQELFLDGIEAAVTWCEENRLKCSEQGSDYSGWNSGGDRESLEKESPESWATAVVHMFLWELTNVLSQRIQERVLEKYKARPPKKPIVEMLRNSGKKAQYFGKSINQLQDIQLFIEQAHCSLVEVLKDELLEANFGKTELSLRRNKANGPISALLFGPPGTSKTQVTKAIADDLGWPMIEINPSEFVKGSFANVYLQAEEIFADLMDLSATVILFDEMDALTQKRGPAGTDSGTNHLDTATQFLTTSMLPKLTALHDGGCVVFFMATNFQENFDPAIKRAGRFDFLLCMGPPISSEKIDKLECFFNPKPTAEQKDKASLCIKDFLKDSEKHQNIFELLTFGDCKSLLKRIIGNEPNIGDKIEKMGKAKFLKCLEDHSETIALKYALLVSLEERDITLKEIDKFSDEKLIKLLESDKLKSTAIAQYLRDRRESKRQY